jgi:hypothetical protein
MTEKRECPRYRADVVIDFTPAESKITGVTWDLSRHGMFVRTSRLPQEGQKLFLTLRFTDGRQLLLQGLVVRTFQAPALARHAGPTGFAVSVKNSESYDRFIASVSEKKLEVPA